MSVIGAKGRLGCINHRARGACSNSKTLPRAPLVQRALIGLRERLAAPELINAFRPGLYCADNREQPRARTPRARRGPGERQAHATDPQSARSDDGGACDGDRTAHAQTAGARRGGPSESGTGALIVGAHPSLPEFYRRKIERLGDALTDNATASVATDALRSLVDSIVGFPGERRGEVTVQLRGDLAAFGGLPGVFGQANSAAAPMSSGAIGSVVGSIFKGRDLDLRDTCFQASR